MNLFPTPVRSPALRAAVDSMSIQGASDRGAVYTRPEVVAAILDLSGYTPDQPLHTRRALEPSFGGGDFLLAMIERLWTAWTRSGGTPEQAVHLASALRAVEVHPDAHAATHQLVRECLIRSGVRPADAQGLADRWLIRDDFLLAQLDGQFDYVLGNPPYVRQERIAEPLLAEYRRRYKTIYDRADLYVPFFERSLDLLTPGGRLGFICANRWVKNKYGGPLRDKIASDFHLAHYIDMEGTNAFHSDVIAYPSITVVERRKGTRTRIARKPEVSAASLGKLVGAMLNGGPSSDRRVEEIPNAISIGDPWLLDDAEQLRVVRRLEAAFPTLEDEGCKVGIGVATGADRIFIDRFEHIPVEPERKIKLAMARDLSAGRVAWGGKGVVNPFEPGGALADLDRYPMFGAYIKANEAVLRARHCASRPGSWYRTIDRIWPDLTTTPKLLIPDIKGEPTVVVDRGVYYPHHNLYWATFAAFGLSGIEAAIVDRAARAARVPKKGA